MSEQQQTTGTDQNTGADAQAAAAAMAAAATANQQTTTDGNGETAAAATGAKPAGAPEKYEFTIPDGKTFDAEVMSVFESTARKHNLTQDAAQELLTEVGTKLTAQREASINAAVEKTKASWAEQAQADKEFGGDKLAENLVIAEKALDTYGTPELVQFLKSSGLSHNPEMVRLFYRLGKDLAEDTPAQGQPKGAGKSAQTFYPKSNMNP